MINKEISKLDRAYKDNEIKIDNKRKKMQDIQAKLIQITKEMQAMKQQKEK